MNSAMNMTATTDKPALTITVKADASLASKGAWPTLAVHLKNEGTTPIELCTYMLRHRLLWSVSAKGPDGDLLMTSFQPSEFAHTSTAAFRTLTPGEELIESVPLSGIDGWHFVRANHQPPVLELSDAVQRPKPGTYTFLVSFTPWAVVYRGEPKKHDRRIAMSRIPDDLGLVNRDISRVFRGEITGHATVTIR